MKWTRFRVKTLSEAEDVIISTLYDIGLEGAQIEDKVPLSAWEKEQMFVDILPQGPEDDGIAYLSFFVEEDEDGKKMPKWFRDYKKQNDKAIKDLQDENAALKSEKAKGERTAAINLKAKELGIPDFLMKRFSIADDADIEKELKEYKQDLVTNKLMPEDKADILSSSQKAMEDDAEAWAKSLPDN